MNILLDAIPLTGLLTGISRYVRNLYTQLAALPDARVHYYNGARLVARMPEQADPGKWMKTTDRVWALPDPMVVGLRCVNWLLFEQRIRSVVRKNRFDVYHETAFTPSALKGADVPQVFTLHDLSLIKCREMHPRERVWFSDLFFQRRIKHADHIITVSEYVRSEIIEELRIPAHAVTTIHEAADPLFYPRDRESVEAMRASMNLPKDYLLFVGTLEPRKNLSMLIEALAACKHDVPLVLTGWKGWGEKEWQEKAKRIGLGNRIHFTGYVDEESLARLYSGALSLVYPSLYEGFGLPLLEAMACGTPVICSNAASLPEVAGDAALLINPHNAEALTHAIDCVCEDDMLRTRMKERGLERAAHFSWEKTARQTLEVFRGV